MFQVDEFFVVDLLVFHYECGTAWKYANVMLNEWIELDHWIPVLIRIVVRLHLSCTDILFYKLFCCDFLWFLTRYPATRYLMSEKELKEIGVWLYDFIEKLQEVFSSEGTSLNASDNGLIVSALQITEWKIKWGQIFLRSSMEWLFAAADLQWTPSMNELYCATTCSTHCLFSLSRNIGRDKRCAIR